VAHFSDWKMPDDDDLGSMFQKRNPRNFTVDGIALPKGWVEVKELTCIKTGRILRKRYFYHESSEVTQWDMPKEQPTRDQILQEQARKKPDMIHRGTRKIHHPGEKYGPVIRPKRWTVGKILVATMVTFPVVVFFSYHINRWRRQQTNIFSDLNVFMIEWMIRMDEFKSEFAVLCKTNLKLVEEHTTSKREAMEAQFAELAKEKGTKIDCDQDQDRKRRLRSL